MSIFSQNPEGDSAAIDFPKLWNKVDSLEKKGLTRTALDEVENIYQLAINYDSTSLHQVKALIYKVKYQSVIEENSEQLAVKQFSQAIVDAQAPIKQILHTYLALYYWQHYQANRWEIMERTSVSVAPEDFLTWDARQYHREISYHFQSSLTQTDTLRQIPTSDLEYLLHEGDSSDIIYRPTLFDILAHEALQYFSADESMITQPVNKFELSGAEVLVDAEKFVDLTFQTTDTLSSVLLATHIYQDLLTFHLNNENSTSFVLVDLDLQRLDFLRANASGEGLDNEYEKCIRQLIENHKEHPVVGEVYAKLARLYITRGQQYDPLVGDDHRWELKEARDICLSVIEKFPETRGQRLCEAIKKQIEVRSLKLEVEEVNLPNAPFLSKLSFRNVDTVYFRLVHAPDIQRTSYGYDRQKLVELLLRQEIQHEWVVELPEVNDFQKHATEIKVDKADRGSYVLLVSDNPDFSFNRHFISYAWTQVSNISYYHRINHHSGNLEVYVMDREKGEPLEGVRIQAYEWDYDQGQYNEFGTSHTTNEMGYMRMTAPKDYRTLELAFTLGNHTYRSKGLYAYAYRREPQDKTQIKTHFFTDRKIYRPGQTIFYKGIVLEKENDQHALKSRFPVEVTLWDVNSQKVDEVSLTTNEYGSFSGSFTAPVTGLLGNMSIKTRGGSTSFSVEEYKRPKFEVRFDSLQNQYQINDTTEIKGIAETFSGIALNEAQVSYRVVRNAQFPYWRGIYRWRPYPQVEAKEITNGVTSTDEKGEFVISFPLTPDLSIPKESNPFFTYQIYVDVTDITGETHSQEASIKAGYVPIVVDIELPDQIDKDQPGMLKFESEVLRVIQDPVKGDLVIYRLATPDHLYKNRKWSRPDTQMISKEAFKELFPHIPYEQEDDYRSWEREAIVTKFEFDTRESRDLPLDQLSDEEPGKYVAEFIAMNGEIKVQKYFTLIDLNARKAPLPMVLTSWVNATRAVPGDLLKLRLMTSEKKIWVLYELEQDGRLLDKQLIRLKGKKKNELEIPVLESYRGNITATATVVYHNQFIQQPTTISIPWDNKELNLTWGTFRSELQPGEKDRWTIKIAGSQQDKVAAEMVATLYDASLDAFRANYFSLFPYPSYYRQLNWNGADGFGVQYAQELAQNWNPSIGYITPRNYQKLNGFDLFYGSYSGRKFSVRGRNMVMAQAQGVEAMAAPSPPSVNREADSSTMADEATTEQFEEAPGKKLRKSAEGAVNDDVDFSEVDIRTNFNETAFFYPHLATNDSGEVIIEFTIPEALTKWKFLGLAHTKDLKIGTITGELVTKKKLMVQPNLPRFIREGDRVVISAKLSNMTEEVLTGSSELQLLDAYTMEPLDSKFQFYQGNKTFNIKPEENLVLNWEVEVPEGIQAIVTRIVAQAGEFSDGEEHVLPVLKNSMLVTEALPLAVRGETEKSYQFEKLMASDTSHTLKQHQLTLEFTSNPIWYAVQALPYLMEFPYECTEQIYSRFYANSLASHIANSDPAIQRTFERWKLVDEQNAQSSLVSNLEKNEELKGILLRETPWLLNAKSEVERKKRLGILFDINRMQNELQRSYRQLQERQYNNGGFSWFPGMPPSRYITQLIAIGLGHLQHLGLDNVQGDAEIGGMIENAVTFLDLAIQEDYQLLKQYGADLQEDHLNNAQIQYLYMRSFYTDLAMAEGTQAAYDYYYSQAKEYWLDKSQYMQGMISLAIDRNGEKEMASEIIRSLKENAVFNEELGMYWKGNQRGYYWYQNDIEKQALLIEAFDEVEDDQESVEEMKIWLLKNKQTNDWETTRATVAACNALIETGVNLLAETQSVEIQLGDKYINPSQDPELNAEAGTGYVKKNWSAENITPKMGNITVKKASPGIAWGAVYWQYFEQLDNITFAETPLTINKGLYIERNTDAGPQLDPVDEAVSFQPGDKAVVRVEIIVDRDMEYVHMKDMRAAGFEPINVFSQYKVRGGLGYYESTRDEATHFFFEYLPKGTHVFEYPLRATHQGDYSNGITTIQCMYAPEFMSHSEGIRVQIAEE